MRILSCHTTILFLPALSIDLLITISGSRLLSSFFLTFLIPNISCFISVHPFINCPPPPPVARAIPRIFRLFLATFLPMCLAVSLSVCVSLSCCVCYRYNHRKLQCSLHIARGNRQYIFRFPLDHVDHIDRPYPARERIRGWCSCRPNVAHNDRTAGSLNL